MSCGWLLAGTPPRKDGQATPLTPMTYDDNALCVLLLRFAAISASLGGTPSTQLPHVLSSTTASLTATAHFCRGFRQWNRTTAPGRAGSIKQQQQVHRHVWQIRKRHPSGRAAALAFFFPVVMNAWANCPSLPSRYPNQPTPNKTASTKGRLGPGQHAKAFPVLLCLT